MSRWSRKSDEEKVLAAEKQKVHSKSKADEFAELVQKSHDLVIKNHEIPLYCPRVRLWSGANNYTIEDRPGLMFQMAHMGLREVHPKPEDCVPTIVGICRCCKQEHTRPLVGDVGVTMMIAALSYELMSKGKLVDKRRMKDESSQARKA